MRKVGGAVASCGYGLPVCDQRGHGGELLPPLGREVGAREGGTGALHEPVDPRLDLRVHGAASPAGVGSRARAHVTGPALRALRQASSPVKSEMRGAPDGYGTVTERVRSVYASDNFEVTPPTS